MLKLGMQNISALYVGGAKIKRALVGTEVVYEAVRPPAVFSISASVTPASGGSVTGAGQYREGDTVTLTYTPAEDHRFTGWYAGNTLLSQANPYTFTAAQDMSITARCEVVPTYTLTLTPTGISAQNWSFSILVNGSGATWSGSGASPSSPAPNPVSVKEGSVTVEATSPDGYEFAGWQIGSGSVVTSNPYTFTITGDTTLYCRYAKKSRLPAGYTELEYLTYSDSGRLGIPITNSMAFTTSHKIEVDFSFIGSKRGRLIDSSYNYCPYIYISDTTGTKVAVRYGANSVFTKTFPAFLGKKTTFQLSSGNIKIGGSSQTFTESTSSSKGILYLASSATNYSGAPGKYYEARIYSGASLISQFIPAKNASGVLGFYDIIKNKFWTPPESYSIYWTAGPAV